MTCKKHGYCREYGDCLSAELEISFALMEEREKCKECKADRRADRRVFTGPSNIC